MKTAKKGFTFIEILIYMGLLATFVAILGSLLFSILDVQLESVGSSDLDHDGQYLLARISYDIRRASSVSLPASPGQSASVFNFIASGVNYAYALDAGNLVVTSGGSTLNLNSFGTTVQTFSLTRLGNPSGKPSFRVSFDLESKAVSLHQKSQTRSYQTTINLR
jgi:hypothetical protein